MQKETIINFREKLTALPSLLSSDPGGKAQKPLIFIIDELDRCKPHFALALLERVKHFMLVPNVHFVLGVHTYQLQSSVRYAYGKDIDAAAYLQKFINLTIFNTDIASDQRATDLHKYAQYLTKALSIRSTRESPLNASIDTIIRLIRHEKMSYRTLERAFTILSLSIGLTPENNLQIGAIMGGLIMMKLLNSDLYIKAKHGTLSLAEAKTFLRFNENENSGTKMSLEKGGGHSFFLTHYPTISIVLLIRHCSDTILETEEISSFIRRMK